eukprot:TRINITY_DN1100_c0_g1_i2.p1 TRINITY_DN1100_c0_g1~~TRINITY_DN1100_c0_g1_i2.p1  ORF type:complete len:391 (+),score=99.68 TRINITY_DN1100_c0_g1_i2:128-1300(+)
MKSALVLLGISASCCSATHVLQLSQEDLTRAFSAKPGSNSALAADTPSSVFPTINNYLNKNVKELGGSLVPCEELTHTQIDEIANKVQMKSVPALMDIYKKRNDNRAFVSFEGTDESDLHSERYNMTRDGKCAQAVMMWAHHIPYEARAALIGEGMRVPLMPKTPQTAHQNPTPLYSKLVSCGSCHYTAGAPGPFTDKAFPRWGGNETTTQYSVKVNMTDASHTPPKWQFNYYFNDDKKGERYEHLAGQDDDTCKLNTKIKPGNPCTIVFSGDEWTYISSPSAGCCKCAKGVMGAVRSDWLRDGTAKSLGNTTINGQVVNEWFKQGASDNHYYNLPDAAMTPVRFMEHDKGQIKQWDFLLETYAPGPQPDSLFEKPANCDKRCSSPLCLL